MLNATEKGMKMIFSHFLGVKNVFSSLFRWSKLGVKKICVILSLQKPKQIKMKIIQAFQVRVAENYFFAASLQRVENANEHLFILFVFRHSLVA